MKTIIDAVNELKGCWPSGVGMAYVYYCHGRWFSSDFPTTDACFCKYDVIACIKECSNNFGNPTTKKESIMIEFNLERALAGDKVINRKGDVVGQFHVFLCSRDDCVYGVKGQHSDGGYVNSYNKEGAYYGEASSDEDLFMAPKSLSGFVNIHANGEVGMKHSTREKANRYPGDRIACIDLSQHNEGEGL